MVMQLPPFVTSTIPGELLKLWYVTLEVIDFGTLVTA